MTKIKLSGTQIREEVERMDPKLAVNDPAYLVAIMLMASAVIGPNVKAIERLLYTQHGSLAKYARAARENGIWHKSKVACAWFEKDGGVAFWLDVCVCLRWLRRTA